MPNLHKPRPTHDTRYNTQPTLGISVLISSYVVFAMPCGSTVGLMVDRMVTSLPTYGSGFRLWMLAPFRIVIDSAAEVNETKGFHRKTRASCQFNQRGMEETVPMGSACKRSHTGDSVQGESGTLPLRKRQKRERDSERDMAGSKGFPPLLNGACIPVFGQVSDSLFFMTVTNCV